MIKLNKYPFKRYAVGVDDAAIAAGISAAGAIGSAAISGISATNLNRKNRKWQEEQAAKQREWNEAMWNKQNTWNLEQWQRTNEYNAPTAQVQRLIDAGLNPLYYGLDGSSANSFEAAQPLGYERAESNPQLNPAGEALNAFAQMKGLENSTRLANAQIDKLKADTHGVELDSEFKEKTMQARVDGVELQNSLTRTQMREIEKKMDVMDKDIELKIQQTNSEIERQALYKAQSILAHASAAEIVYLLPFRANLLSAQTEAQKAAASSSYMHALYEKGLIDGGYVDALCKEAKHNAKIAEYGEQTAIHNARRAGHEADIEKFKSSVRNGTLFTGDSWWDNFGNDVFGALSALSEALGGSLVPLVAGFGLGKIGSSGSSGSGASADVVDKQIQAMQ